MIHLILLNMMQYKILHDATDIIVLYILHIVVYILHIVLYILYIVLYILHTVLYILHTVLYILHIALYHTTQGIVANPTDSW